MPDQLLFGIGVVYPQRVECPDGGCRTLPRSGYTEQPRALALGYQWREIRPESGGRGVSPRVYFTSVGQHRAPLSGHLEATS